MPCEITEEVGCLLVIKISGKLAKREVDALQKDAVELIRREGKVRVLVLGDNFKGWEHEGDWGDLSFLMKYDAQIERIAMLGEKKWEDLALAFMGKGMRAAQVEYFPPGQLELARAWVTSGSNREQ